MNREPAPPDDAREAALNQYRTASRCLYEAAARMRSAGLLADVELYRYKRKLKNAGRRLGRLEPTEIAALAAEYRDMATRFEFRVVRPTVASEPSDSGNSCASIVPPASLEHTTASVHHAATGRRVRIDETRNHQTEVIAQRYYLICLMHAGVSAAEAIARTGIACATRTARYLARRYADMGEAALRDGRWSPSHRPPNRKMTSEVQSIVLRTWYSYPAAGPKAVWKVASEECGRQQVPVPGYHSVYLFLRTQPRDAQLLRAGKLETIRKEMTAKVRFTMAARANERFQIDHTQMDLWVKELEDGKWVPKRVWCTAVMDEFSRTIAGFILSTAYPDAWAIALALRHAIRKKDDVEWLNKGIPSVLQPDRGRDFMSKWITASCASLGIELDPDPPYYPDRKGKIERWFRTLDTGCLRTVPGHKEAIGTSDGAAEKQVNVLLNLSELRREVERFIVTDYHTRVHRELRQPPGERWLESIGVPRMPEGDDALNLLLMQTDGRTVQNTGIDFRGERYWAPELARHVKAQVLLRFDPEDAESVLVYMAESNRFLCEAKAMGYTDSQFRTSDVKEAARRAHQDLLDRTGARMATAAREGRRSDAARAASSVRHPLVVDVSLETGAGQLGDAEAERLLRKIEDKATAE